MGGPGWLSFWGVMTDVAARRRCFTAKSERFSFTVIDCFVVIWLHWSYWSDQLCFATAVVLVTVDLRFCWSYCILYSIMCRHWSDIDFIDSFVIWASLTVKCSVSTFCYFVNRTLFSVFKWHSCSCFYAFSFVSSRNNKAFHRTHLNIPGRQNQSQNKRAKAPNTWECRWTFSLGRVSCIRPVLQGDHRRATHTRTQHQESDPHEEAPS